MNGERGCLCIVVAVGVGVRRLVSQIHDIAMRSEWAAISPDE